MAVSPCRQHQTQACMAAEHVTDKPLRGSPDWTPHDAEAQGASATAGMVGLGSKTCRQINSSVQGRLLTGARCTPAG